MIASEAQAGGELDLLLGPLLGTGGMAVVHEADQLALGRVVAVKRAKRAGDIAQSKALLREAWTAAQLDHPNIVPVHLVGETAEGEVVVVMRRLRGESWADLLRREPPESAAGLHHHVEILVSVCNAVHYAHSRGVLHRDIKPSNVRLGPFGEVYLVDWGIAERLDAGRSPTSGTIAYMAPETRSGAPLDPRTEVYLVGATLCELLCGRPPHADGDAGLPEFDSDLYPALEAVFRRACATRPEERFGSVRELRDALTGWLHSQGVDEAVALAISRLQALSEDVEEIERDPSDPLRLAAVNARLTDLRQEMERSLGRAPGHSSGADALAQTVELIVRAALARGDVVGARAQLSAWEGRFDTSAIAVRITETAARLEDERRESERLTELGRVHDVGVARRQLAMYIALLSLAFVTASAVPYLLAALGIETDVYVRRLTLLGAVATAHGGLVWMYRARLTAHPSARWMVNGMGFFLASVGAERAAAVFTRPAPDGMLQTELWMLFIYLCMTAQMGGLHWLLVTLSAAAAFAAGLQPAHADDIFSVTVLVVAVGLIVEMVSLLRGKSTTLVD